MIGDHDGTTCCATNAPVNKNRFLAGNFVCVRLATVSQELSIL
jgi:hypothetical protein